MYIQPGFPPLAFEGKKKTEQAKKPGKAKKTPVPKDVDKQLKNIATKYNVPLAKLQDEYRWWVDQKDPQGNRMWDDGMIVGLIDAAFDPNAPRRTTQALNETGIRG